MLYRRCEADAPDDGSRECAITVKLAFMSFGPAKPLATGAGWALGSYLAAIGVHLGAGGNVEISLRALIVCLAGALYTNLFEHVWHRHAMHSRRPDPRHATHH